MPSFFDAAKKGCDYYYRIEYNGRKHDIVCPGYTLKDGRYVVIIPWYLIPGRPYPIQVYLFASELYSSDPKLGQRGAAEATRIKFDLETFSHSTVCRSFKSIEDAQRLSLEHRFGEEAEIDHTKGITIIKSVPKASTKGDKAENSGTDKKQHKDRRFPSVTDTADRRKALRGFLPKFKKNAKIIKIETAGCRFVKNWHKKSGRLLL